MGENKIVSTNAWKYYTDIHPHKHKFGGSMKRPLMIMLIGIAAVGAAAIRVAVLFCGFLIWSVFTIPREVDAQREFLLKQIDHQAVANACLEVMTKPEYRDVISSTTSGDAPRWPSAIRAVKPIDVLATSTSVTIMTTCGHIHMGLVFAASKEDTNRFDLMFWDEAPEGDVLLYSVRR